MKAPAIPANESERLQALDKLDILYSPAEERFDRTTRIARRLFDMPIVLVSLITKDTQWFKSCQGLTVSETSREISFCGHAILSDDIFVVPNALKDPDFCDNPLVIGEPKIRFYAGQPLHFAGQRLGTLCLIDRRPRQLKPSDYDSIKCLASWVETELLNLRNENSSYFHQLLGLEGRQQLLDPVTGDLNEKGVTLLKQKLEHTESLEDEPAENERLQILVKISNMPQDIEQSSIDQMRKYVAQTTRAAVDDKGIIGQQGTDGFTVILPSTAREQADKMVVDINQRMNSYIGQEFDMSFIKPIVSVKLAEL